MNVNTTHVCLLLCHQDLFVDVNNEGKLFVISLYEGKPALVTECPGCFTSSCSLVSVFNSLKMDIQEVQ